MKKVIISDFFRQTCPQLALGLVSCRVANSNSDADLWMEIANEEARIREDYSMELINKRPAIQATRRAYKAFGKDPNRYRPSAEALCRRIVKEMDLYRINTLVDLINLVSIRTGYSIGGFDEDKIVVDTLTLTVGTADDVFEGIGRGLLNIEGLPVYRDGVGGIGTPTSDNERTKLSVETTHLLMIINGYNGNEGLQQAIDYAVKLLQKYAQATEFEVAQI